MNDTLKDDYDPDYDYGNGDEESRPAIGQVWRNDANAAVTFEILSTEEVQDGLPGVWADGHQQKRLMAMPPEVLYRDFSLSSRVTPRKPPTEVMYVNLNGDGTVDTHWRRDYAEKQAEPIRVAQFVYELNLGQSVHCFGRQRGEAMLFGASK